MNAVEIEEAVSELVAQPFEATEFPFQFITAFGAKKTTVDRLRKGDSNQSDIGGVLQRNNVHIAVAPSGQVQDTLAALRASPKTVSQKAKFILTTDGETVEAEDLVGGDVIACAYADLPRYFATFLPLAGISTVKEIKNNPVDVKATGRLNKLYVTLLNDNPDWATEERRHELNQFMARLIFCYFAEDTGIFNGEGLFTSTVAKMSEAGHGSGDAQWGNTHEVLQHLFLAMETPVKHEGNFDDRYRRAAGIRPYADVFPYVNGGLFTAAGECPRFSRTARAYLLSAGELDWKEINPDIFGSMIQAVADDGERGELGMHYTSVPNILKVLNPLFLDDLREQLEAAGDSKQKLRNLRKRLANIRVFDPACGSGNFLVIAYKQMRAIEAEIVDRLGGEANLKLDERRSVIPLSNFYGIEIKGFAAEIARLALLIAEFQADCLYLSQQEARAIVLPLHKTGQITVDNALRLDWLKICPPESIPVAAEHDLAGPTGRLLLEDNGLARVDTIETYICGNPPFSGTRKQSLDQKSDLERVFSPISKSWKNVDYVGAWFMQAAIYNTHCAAPFAFVATNSFCQGQQVAITWQLIFDRGLAIRFAHTSFEWKNLAANKAGVTVVIVGLDSGASGRRTITTDDIVQEVEYINPYLTHHNIRGVSAERSSLSGLPKMDYGVYYSKSEGLMLDFAEHERLVQSGFPSRLLKRFLGSTQFINGVERYCLWLGDGDVEEACSFPDIRERIERVRRDRIETTDVAVNKLAERPYQFRERKGDDPSKIFVPIVSSVNRPYLPCGIAGEDVIPSNKAFYIAGGPLWTLAILTSRLHLCWIATVCGHLRNDYSYSNILGWNTFPAPIMTDQDKADLKRCAENILLAREAQFPSSIANVYDLDEISTDLRRAHEENDEVLERIYIGRRFRNDTERLEKLFEMYTKMTESRAKPGKGRKAA
ncbi:DNA methyltransferase [Sphingobium sp. BS19]|uniref:class I SAM-dependent DNA methyltransferase n=1 Tax=Sphingobium sp. BS19 TaxID=3018973 RepID=UPI0022EE0E08|nr:DNA methyltransferase [Sphingobium sp. BS19]GLI97022.1 hypothetical protein Sbs19_08400 [Sphingobium sp. BS19]